MVQTELAVSPPAWFSDFGCTFVNYYPAQGVKQSVCPSVVVVVVVGTKIARSRVLGICACCKHNQLVDIVEKLVCTPFELLKRAY